MKLYTLNVGNVLKVTMMMFKFSFLELLNNIDPDFENLYYLLHLNTSESNEESSSDNSESKQGCSINLCRNVCFKNENEISRERFLKILRKKQMQKVIKL